MTLRRRTIEHVFGTLKHWMGSTHFLTRGLQRVGTEMSLHVLAYNLKRVIKLLGMAKTIRRCDYWPLNGCFSRPYRTLEVPDIPSRVAERVKLLRGF